MLSAQRVISVTTSPITTRHHSHIVQLAQAGVEDALVARFLALLQGVVVPTAFKREADWAISCLSVGAVAPSTAERHEGTQNKLKNEM